MVRTSVCFSSTQAEGYFCSVIFAKDRVTVAFFSIIFGYVFKVLFAKVLKMSRMYLANAKMTDGANRMHEK